MLRICSLLFIALLSFVPFCSSHNQLRGEIKELASDLKRLWDINEIQNDKIETMREQLDQKTKEISELQKKNENLENELTTLKKKHNETSEEVSVLRTRSKNLEDNLTATQRAVFKLEEMNENLEKDLFEFKIQMNEILRTLTPTSSTTTIDDNSNGSDTNTTDAPKSCQDVKIENAKNRTESGGVFDIYVEEIGKEIEVSCDLTTDGGGWTVFQRRMDGSEDFYRGWDDYVNGFGKKDGEFWLGLENIYQMTKNGKYELRIDLGDFFKATAYAKYESFSIESSAGDYRLYVGAYNGTAGDSLSPSNEMKFSTRDNDNDDNSILNCADYAKGGWWYSYCGPSNLNGLYNDEVGIEWDGVWWLHWKMYNENLKFTEIKFRRVE